MPQYICNVQATSNGSTNTDDTFIEIAAPAATIIKVKRYRVAYGDGTQTAGQDNHLRIRILRKSAAGVGTTTTFTSLAKRANSPPSVCTVKIKSGTNNFTTPTIRDTVDVISMNARMIYEWIARDDDDIIVILPGDLFAIAVSSGVVSQPVTATCEWVE